MTAATAPSDASRAASAKAGTRLALEASDLKHALAVVAPAVAGRSPTAATQHVLVQSGTVTATDGDLRIEATIVEGAPPTVPVLLPHGKLAQIAGACARDSEIRIDIGETSCTIKNRGGKWVLPTCPVSEFPAVVAATTKPLARMPGDQLARCLSTVLPAVDRASARGGAAGVLLESRDGVVWFVATDGRRLHVHEAEIDQAVDNLTVTVPARVAVVLLRMAEDAGAGAIQLEAGRATLTATGAGRTLTAGLLSGAFPDWRKLVPAPADQPTRVFAGALLSATRAASITTSETSRGVGYAITSEGILLSAISAEAGQSSVACSIVEAGVAQRVMLAPDYVVQFLDAVEAAEVVALEATGPESPVILRCEDRLALIAPLSP